MPFLARSTVPRNQALRRYGAAVLITSIGNGAWYTCWVLFLTRFAGLSPAQVGIGITVAGSLGVLVGAPLGRLADRVGPRRIMVPLVASQAVGFAAYGLVHDFVSFLVVASVTVAADRGSYGVRGALTLGYAGADDRLLSLSAMRVRNSVGFTLGAVVGALAIAADTRAGYIAVALLNSATFVVYAVLIARTRETAAPRPAGVDPEIDLDDGPARRHPLAYATLAATMGVLSLCWGMLSSGVPLWVARHTYAPHWISGVIVILNAAAIAALQTPFTRRISSATQAARGAVAAGLALAVSCPIFALSYHLGGLGAIALLLCAACVHVIGELLFVASSWGLSVLLMPVGAAGRYQGIFSTGQTTGLMVGPAVMTTLVVGWAPAGWLVLGVVFILAAAPTTIVTRRALTPRAPQPAGTPAPT